MTNPGNLTLSAQGDREIVMTRAFNAPRHLVFDALTKPELVRRWLLGPPGWSMPVCEIGVTTMTVTLHYQSPETPDAVLKSPMEQGVAASYDRLAAIVETA